MTSISRSKLAAGYRRSTTAGTACLFGRVTFARRSSCGSRSAASALSGASGPGPPWWTMWSHIGETGRNSLIQPTIRACASDVTTEKQPRKWRKNEGKIEADSSKTSKRLGACARPRCACACPRKAYGFLNPPPGSKCFGLRAVRPQAPLREGFFPHGGERTERS